MSRTGQNVRRGSDLAVNVPGTCVCCRTTLMLYVVLVLFLSTLFINKESVYQCCHISWLRPRNTFSFLNSRRLPGRERLNNNSNVFDESWFSHPVQQQSMIQANKILVGL
jgi:hypothetical protein